MFPNDYDFTTDWFDHNIPTWERVVKPMLNSVGNTRFLEIGSFEGRSTAWIIENLASKDQWVLFDCIDSWEGGEEHQDISMNEVFDRFTKNRNILGEQFKNLAIYIHKGKSFEKLLEIITGYHKTFYDFVYIDGSHQAKDVMADAILSWKMLKHGGIMIFDDYLWHPKEYEKHHTPGPAINAFLYMFSEELDILHSGYQVIVRKKDAIT